MTLLTPRAMGWVLVLGMRWNALECVGCQHDKGRGPPQPDFRLLACQYNRAMSAPLPAAGQPGIAPDAHVAPAAPAGAEPARRGIAEVQALVAAEMEAVDALIRARLDS